MAKCFDVVGYIEPCNAVRQKYTGRALLIAGDTLIANLNLSDNGLKVTGIANQSASFVDALNDFKGKGGSGFSVSIDAQNPFSVTVQGNTDSGRVMYTKTIPVSIPATRDGKAEEFIMGLQKGLHGCAIVLETFGLDESSSVSNNDFFGAYSPVRLDPTSVTRSEYENGGSWQFNLVCEEPVPNVICTIGGLNTALDTLNA